MSTTAAPTSIRERAIQSISKLPPFSPVLTKLLASLSKDDIMVAELADWIEKDTVLTGNVMRIVNSAAYGRMGTVSSVRHAITILGTNRLRNIVLGLSVCNMLGQLKLPAGWSSRQFNMHSIAVANLADLLAQHLTIEYSEGAFVGGLLHDVGKLLLAVSCPDEYSAIISEARCENKEIYEVEILKLGLSHAELSQKVLETWKLPIPVQTAARFHHNPDADSTAPGLTALSRGIQMADYTVNALNIQAVADAGKSGTTPEASDPMVILQAFGLGDRADRILKDFEKEMESIKAIL
ncbi:MAG: HDOD domain-containing protein [Acidobacteria bacterium]|nr:HDOD domain-containing protein [Acidobacteriota bacterium]